MNQNHEQNASKQIDPAAAPAAPAADAAVNAMGVAMANRDAIMKSLFERREQVFELLEAQRDEALRPMLQAKDLLQQAHTSIDKTAHSSQPLIQSNSSDSDNSISSGSRQRLGHALGNGLMVLLSLQGAGGAAAKKSKDQAILEITDALIRLIESEVDKNLP
jgi:type VI protein secretion system component VasK